MGPFKVVLADDHVLLRHGLASMVEKNPAYSIQMEVSTGKELIEKLDPKNLPDIVLMDINMPEMDGYETTSWLKRNFPDVKVIALSVYDTENAIIRMFKAGARGYLAKGVDEDEFFRALEDVVNKGYCYSDFVTGRLIHTINQYEDLESAGNGNPLSVLNDREMEFLRLACSEMTYKEIADRMYLSPRTIDGYRDTLFDKLRLKTRVGLVTFAIRNGLVTV